MVSMWFWGECQSLNTVCAVHLTAAVGSDGGCLTQQSQLDCFSQNLLARCSLFSVRTLDTWSYELPWALAGSWSLAGERTVTQREQGQNRHSYYLSAGSSGFRLLSLYLPVMGASYLYLLALFWDGFGLLNANSPEWHHDLSRKW